MKIRLCIIFLVLIIPAAVLAQSAGVVTYFFSSPPTILSSAVLTIFLLVVFFLYLYRKDQRLEALQKDLDLSERHPQWIRNMAKKLSRSQLYRPSGDLYLYLGEHAEAAAMYLKGKNYVKAADAYLAAGLVREAAAVYEETDEYEEAAKLYLQVSDHLNAAKMYTKEGNRYKAAQNLERASHLQEAAEAYLEQRLFRKAAEMYEALGQPGRAADALQRNYDETVAHMPQDISVRDNVSLVLLTSRIGELYQKDGRMPEAAEAFHRAGLFEQAARALEAASSFEKASQVYLEAGMLMDGARCLEKMGKTAEAGRIKAQALLAEGKTAEAIPYLDQAGEYERVARLYMELNDTEKAGEYFEKAGKFEEAAEMFSLLGAWEHAAANEEQAGNFIRAADFYEKAGNPGRQAEILERVKEFYQASEIYEKLGLADQAIESLQKVERGHPDYERAMRRLGDVFRGKGMNNLARECFRRIVENQDLTRANLDDYYEMARCDEQMNDIEKAMEVYEKILVSDYRYKDVADRVSTIKSGRTFSDMKAEHTPEDTELRGILPISGPAPVILGEGMRYQLFEVIGRGGMGIVYRARDTILERDVAYKVLPANLKDHPQALRNFFREAKSAARLSHPNIVVVFDAGEEGGNYYIAMEMLKGKTVKEILNEENRMPLKAVLMISGQVCRALEYAHSQRIVHRDIKSSNLMWTPEKQVKIMDFGLAKVMEEVKGYQTIASGTPYYMSPEQTLGKDLDHRTDVYSLGITMFEMATGQLPFRHGDAAYHHVHTPPPTAKDVYPDIPRVFSEIILKCMQKNPEDRYQTAEELFNALKGVREA